MWSFSEHILERIEERNISKEDILSIVNNNVDIIIVPSDKDKTVDLYFGAINNKYILVVVNRESKNLITTRNMRKSEKRVYNEAGRQQVGCSPMQPKEIENGRSQN